MLFCQSATPFRKLSKKVFNEGDLLLSCPDDINVTIQDMVIYVDFMSLKHSKRGVIVLER